MARIYANHEYPRKGSQQRHMFPGNDTNRYFTPPEILVESISCSYTTNYTLSLNLW